MIDAYGNPRFVNLPPLDPRWTKRDRARQATWLWSVLDYLAHESWRSNDDAREWLAGELHKVGIETNRAPYPPPFDLPDPFVNLANGRSGNSKCRQRWWARSHDHKGWIKNQIRWLTGLLACIGTAMDYDADWQTTLKTMLAVYRKTDCGCTPSPRAIARPLRSGADIGLYS